MVIREWRAERESGPATRNVFTRLAQQCQHVGPGGGHGPRTIFCQPDSIMVLYKKQCTTIGDVMLVEEWCVGSLNGALEVDLTK